MLASDRPRRAGMTPKTSIAIPDTPVTSKPAVTVAIGRMAVCHGVRVLPPSSGIAGNEAEVFEEGRGCPIGIAGATHSHIPLVTCFRTSLSFENRQNRHMWASNRLALDSTPKVTTPHDQGSLV